MKTATVQLESMTAYSQSKYVAEKRGPKETGADFEELDAGIKYYGALPSDKRAQVDAYRSLHGVIEQSTSTHRQQKLIERISQVNGAVGYQTALAYLAAEKEGK